MLHDINIICQRSSIAYMVAVVSIVNRCGLSVDVHHRNQPNKSTLVLYKPLIYFNSHLEQLYISICCYVVLGNV